MQTCLHPRRDKRQAWSLHRLQRAGSHWAGYQAGDHVPTGRAPELCRHQGVRGSDAHPRVRAFVLFSRLCGGEWGGWLAGWLADGLAGGRALATLPGPPFCVNGCWVADSLQPLACWLVVRYVDAGLKVWSGNDDDMHFCRHVLGAQGSISVAANVVPGLYHQLLFGERDDALNEELAPLVKWLFDEPNPIGVNTLLMQLGACGPHSRLPYVGRFVL